MIFGIGTDIIEVQRVEKLVGSIAGKKRIFSDSEIAYCESKKNKGENYAARYAAKEAFFKAFGTGWRGKMSFNEVIIKNNRLGKPDIELIGDTLITVQKKKISKIHVSLTHLKDIVNAVVILEKF
ncbi:MAG: holo-ACP synthase [Bacteroidetes bacterium]|nr:holo-ACP synthase [Bacteroidota bacterium]MBK9672569.1 holo-ACP synthase [Bacteroidota bacterium]MBP6413072.1 holo-ACP synthase [Bacteroidia bacterium]